MKDFELSHDVRVLEGDEITQAEAVFRTSMIGLPPEAEPTPEERAAGHEPGRALGVHDAGDLVGTAESYGSWLVVPGGKRVPHAAVTHVGVLPTHTRRGIVTALMRRQFEDIAARGEIVASLRASEAVIYERFGYGVASECATYDVDRRRAVLRDSVPAGSPVRLADPRRLWKQWESVYEPAAWTGAIGRYEPWWRTRERWAAADTSPQYAAVTADGDGYALYKPGDPGNWFSGDNRTIVVTDFVAHTAAAYVGLVRHLVTLDFTDTIRFLARPVDDPLPTLFTDRRAVRKTSVRDETWLRLVDVSAALAARRYASGPVVVVEVKDEFLPSNNGRYRIGGRPHEVARPDSSRPDLTIGAAALASVYLGGTRWAALAQAGQVTEHRAGAVASADQLFSTAAAPFAGTGF